MNFSFRILVIFGVFFYFQQANATLPKGVTKESANCTIINIPQDQPGYKAIEDATKKSFKAFPPKCFCCGWLGRQCVRTCCVSIDSPPTGQCGNKK